MNRLTISVAVLLAMQVQVAFADDPPAVQTAIARATEDTANCRAQNVILAQQGKPVRPECPTETPTPVPTATPTSTPMVAAPTAEPTDTATPTPTLTATPTDVPDDDVEDIPTVTPLSDVDSPGVYQEPPRVVTVVVERVEQITVVQDHEIYVVVTATPDPDQQVVATLPTATETPIPTATATPLDTAMPVPTSGSTSLPMATSLPIATAVPIAKTLPVVPVKLPDPPKVPVPVHHDPEQWPLLVGLDTLRARYGLVAMLIGLQIIAGTQVMLP